VTEAAHPRSYRSQILVRFADCDPAQMVFYPRYLTMFNDLVEDWFRDELKLPFSYYHLEQQHGLPTVHLEVDFVAPSRLGEVLSATLTVKRVGTSSITLNILFRGPDGSDRVRGTVVLVVTDLRSSRAVPIADDLRSRILDFCDIASDKVTP
jgi:4-hydroxybenzoyl-CoA thioesterase